MKPAKAATFRFAEEAHKMLAMLAKREHRSKSNMIEMLIRAAAEKKQ